MRDNRTVAPAPSVRVQGLGWCDVLRIQLEPCQIAGLIDELEERRGPLHEEFEHARARWDALDESQRMGRLGDEVQGDLSESAYALWVFGAIREQLPAIDHGGAVSLVGPAAIMADLVAAGTRHAVHDLAERVGGPSGTREKASARLRDAAMAVAAWVETYAECEALVWFSFDEGRDPVHDITWPR